MSTQVNGIWPERVIKLNRRGHMEGEPETLTVATQAAVLAAVTMNGARSLLTMPVHLDEHKIVQLVALVQIGNDGIGDGQLLVRATYEREYNTGPLIRLAVVSYPKTSGPSTYRPPMLHPDAAAKILNEMVEAIRAESPDAQSTSGIMLD